ncbi:TonB-dependent receptor plug domain-containing protein [Aliikangiella sp. IMCC44359]|uniref:TonB-dependent receptor plug domain-containing protein n=1 Tax=Aliikangiella sp. IMCC44359 TaxID=3459125 RepID=UPI00403A8281
MHRIGINLGIIPRLTKYIGKCLGHAFLYFAALQSGVYANDNIITANLLSDVLSEEKAVTSTSQTKSDVNKAQPAAKPCEQYRVDCVVVTGSRYSISNENSNHFMSKQDIEKLPHFADDIFRMMPAMPGITSGDFSAKFFVRGSDYSELLVMFDGQELYRPFHLKDYGSVFSIVDTDLVGSLDFSSGGYGAEYGNKMGGVLNINSLSYLDRDYSLGMNFLVSKIHGQGSYNDGEWQLFARRGYLDIILELDGGDDDSDSDLKFGDFFAKVDHQINSKHQLLTRLLVVADSTQYKDSYIEQENIVDEKLNAEYDNTYFWTRLESDWSEKLSSNIKLAIGELSEFRQGHVYDPTVIDVNVDDRRSFDFIDLTQQTVFHVNNDSLLKFGLGIMSTEAKYDYHSRRFLYEEYQQSPTLRRDIVRKFSGERYHAYVNHKYQINASLYSEIGLRWDSQNDLGFSESNTSPRLSLAYLVNDRSSLRFSWGHYFQSAEVLELQVEDGVTEFKPAQRAEHRIIGYQHEFGSGISLRTEAYEKIITDPIARFENVFDSNVPFPENQADRVLIAPNESNMRGIELSAKQQVNDKFSWASSYVWSIAEDIIDNKKFNRSWNQEHALKLDFNYLSDGGWNSHLSMTYHSGWPTTSEYGVATLLDNGEYDIERFLGPRNAANLDDYLRFDIRFSKRLNLQNSDFTYYFEIFNLTDHTNQCCVANSRYQVLADGQVAVKQEHETWVGRIPTVGFSWDF